MEIINVEKPDSKIFYAKSGFELAVCNSQFAKYFGSLRMGFCISTICESLKSDTYEFSELFIELAMLCSKLF